MRAGSLQELVYKNGQAGISKATVTVTFDNANKEQSPLGYEQYDEITVTRQVRTLVPHYHHLLTSLWIVPFGDLSLSAQLLNNCPWIEVMTTSI